MGHHGPVSSVRSSSGAAALERLFDLGERQLGLVRVEQARAAGLTAEQQRYQVRSGRLDLVTRRVLRIPGSPRTDHQSVLTAVFDASPGAWACGPTVAALWGVPGHRLHPVHVVRVRGVSGRRSSLAVLHEVRDLPSHHVTVLHAIPVVRPERMVLDLAASEHPRRVARALDSVWRRRLLSGRSMRACLDEVSAQGRPGLAVVRALLDERGDDYVPPDSNLERRFASIVTEAGLPDLRRQVDSGGDRWVGRVDFRDASLPLVVEVQSETYHSALTDKADDAVRRAALEAAGFTVVEVTEEQVWHRPGEVVDAVRKARAALRART
jgi:very-short-patch-repair endonuclease